MANSGSGNTSDSVVVMVTCGSLREARKIAGALVEQRLAACVNVLGAPVRSIFRWKGKVESAAEYLLVIKTSRARLSAVETEVKRMHSYDVPEVIALPITGGSADYLEWLRDSVGEPAGKGQKR